MKNRSLLIIEDDPGLASQMRWCVEDIKVAIAATAEDAITQLRLDPPQVITLDLGLPPDPGGVSVGLQLLDTIQNLLPRSKVIVITGREERSAALDSLASGASDFYSKPIDAQTLSFVINRAFHIYELEEENRRLALAAYHSNGGSDDSLIAQSACMLKLKQQIDRVANADINVLITGETGTGKELVAKALHTQSNRSTEPLIAINCAAIPENLLESELFGHEKGAFTGATTCKPGKIEAASGGTLFLDEIGDMPIALQAKLLRFTEDRFIERLGSNTRIPVDVRLVSATHQNIDDHISAGHFRQDLYFRLAEINLQLPPLRERGGDALVIANHLLRLHGANDGRGRGKGKALKFSAGAAAAIDAWEWPGNVRELENRIKRACILTDSQHLSAADLELIDVTAGMDELPLKTHEHSSTATPLQVREKHLHPQPLNLQEVRRAAERDAILRALARTQDNVSQAARLLGVTRPTLYNLIDKYDIRPKSDPTPTPQNVKD